MPSKPETYRSLLLSSNLEEMAAHANKGAQLIRALANPHRLMVLCTLADGEMSVSELNERVPLSQSALSQHLAVLRSDQLVTTRREAQTVYYSLEPGPAVEIIGVLHSHFCSSANDDKDFPQLESGCGSTTT